MSVDRALTKRSRGTWYAWHFQFALGLVIKVLCGHLCSACAALCVLEKPAMRHELWIDPDGLDTFCLSGKHGDEARALLEPNSKLIWTCVADSHFEAMTKYYRFRGYGVYETNHPEHDKKSYKELGFE